MNQEQRDSLAKQLDQFRPPKLLEQRAVLVFELDDRKGAKYDDLVRALVPVDLFAEGQCSGPLPIPQKGDKITSHKQYAGDAGQPKVASMRFWVMYREWTRDWLAYNNAFHCILTVAPLPDTLELS